MAELVEHDDLVVCEDCGRASSFYSTTPEYKREGDAPLDIMEWCKGVIEGPTGMNSWQSHEMVIFDKGYDDRTHAAAFVLRCLANPRCEDSQYVLDAIMERRAEAQSGEQTT